MKSSNLDVAKANTREKHIVVNASKKQTERSQNSLLPQVTRERTRHAPKQETRMKV